MFYRWKDGSLELFCHLQPGASREEFAGTHGDRLKIKLLAPPIEGKANAALIKFLAKQFAVPKSRVTLLSGETSRQKTVAIENPLHLPAELPIAIDASL